jgi:hypothetical protein
MAKGWIERRERELDKPGGLEAAKIGKETLGDAIDKYVATSRKKIGKTKAHVLEAIKGMDIAEKQCRIIDSEMLIELAEDLLKSRQPQTVANYMSHLQAVFAVAKPAWGMELDLNAIKGAHAVGRPWTSSTRSSRVSVSSRPGGSEPCRCRRSSPSPSSLPAGKRRSPASCGATLNPAGSW